MTGPATVIEAVGAAREAAEAIDRYLRGEQIEVAESLSVSEKWRQLARDSQERQAHSEGFRKPDSS